MAPKWPQVNNGPEHINEHATYLREACNQLQAVDKGRQNQVPWNIVQPYLASTLALIGKVLRQPAMGEILQHVQDAARCTQNIQKDVTLIKNSVGLSTTPLNRANFNRTGNTAATWAQVAAQAKGAPPPPPPAAHGITAAKAPPTVTAYKDRVITVKLKDHGVAQRFRAHSAAWIRQQVETSIRDNTPTRLVKVVAAHQLKSGDIQIFASTTAEAAQLKQNSGWVKSLGEHAELVVPTYGVIVHGIPTNSINIKDQDATSQQMIADNYTVIPHAKISYIGWLTKEATLKRASSIVVEFTDPEMANAIIYAGMAWEGQIHQCQLYDRACRVKQCFRCYNYGHIGTQCNAPQVCGYCTEQHESKHCKQKGMEGFTPHCAVCKDNHTAWSNACPARRKEMRRVEQAKETRSIYWHVPVKERGVQPETQRVNGGPTPREGRIRQRSAPSYSVVQIRAPVEPDSTLAIPLAQQAETMIAIDSPTAPSAEEDWQTPVMQQEQELQRTQADADDLIDPQLLAAGGSASPIPEDSQHLLPTYPSDGLDGDEEAAMQDADAWLQTMAVDNDGNRLNDPANNEPSPITSIATDTRTAQGQIFKACKCPEHQNIYSAWPTHNAELTIAHCMKTCMYCGKDFSVAGALRKHIRKAEYAQRNLKVRSEVPGRGGASTPGWTHRPRAESPTLRERTRTTRSRSLTDGPYAAPHPW